MQSSEDEDYHTKIEIQKTLMSIKDITLKIKTELDVLNDIAKLDGQLHKVLRNAVATLTTIAENMDIDVENVLSNGEEQQELQHNLRNVVSAATFQEKILACLNINKT